MHTRSLRTELQRCAKIDKAAREAQMRATRKLMRTRVAETLPQMLQKDVDNTTLLVFDLGTGHLLRSESLARPVVWMGLLQ